MKTRTKMWLIILTLPIWGPIAWVLWTIEDIIDHCKK
jgi:hypothetical protein